VIPTTSGAGDPLAEGRHRAARFVMPSDLFGVAQALFADGMRLALVSGHDDGAEMRAVYLFTAGPPDRRVELYVPLERARPEVPTLAGLSFPASRFERELQDLFGIVPVGHPQPRRLVLHQHWPEGWHPMRHDDRAAPPLVADGRSYPFVPVEGSGVYEIPVGPVHAGLIEPGHFRFWVVGETILRMKARLWFVHKGIERHFEGQDAHQALALAERISGDTAVGHALAYCQAIEDASQLVVAENAGMLRAALLELERLYNHVADIGALCNDVGFGLAQAWALDLREHLLRLNRDTTGHRLLRGGVILGGARIRSLPTPGQLTELGERFEQLVGLATSSALVMDRFAGAAVLDRAHAVELGVVGPSGRASGLDYDARVAHPSTTPVEGFSPAVQTGGDVLARFRVWADEVRASLNLLAHYVEAVGTLDDVATAADRSAGELARSGVGIAEGWRGVIVHRVEVDGAGRLSRVKVVDPSFFNWPALPVSLADTIVPDFPLANKSFNLSYAGNDL
jgi:Ni,Fe-hydrogenase III large subunit/Ni,Fe-hydrogenase III component G